MMQQIDDLILIKQLGKGGFGQVYLSQKKNSNKYFATKKLNKAESDTKYRRYLLYEINILKTLNHPNIIKLEEVKKTTNHYYIVMEFANGGELSKCLEKYKLKYHRAFPEEIVQYLMRQIVSALSHIHNLNIIHRDLKLENIMLNFDSEKDKQELNMMKAQIKIIDFGCAIILPYQGALGFTVVGSRPYMDPLILEEYYNQAKADKRIGYGPEVDIWSLGCVCYHLYMGKIPFQGKNTKEIIDKINQGKYVLPKNRSPELSDFLTKMLQYDGKSRLTAKQLGKHPFLIKNINDFGNMQIIPTNNEPNNFNEFNEPNKVNNYSKFLNLKDTFELMKMKKEKEKEIEKKKSRDIHLNYKKYKSSPINYPIEENALDDKKSPIPEFDPINISNFSSGEITSYHQPVSADPHFQKKNIGPPKPSNSIHQINYGEGTPYYGGAGPNNVGMPNQQQYQNMKNPKDVINNFY